MTKAIVFDMDGTIADFYGVEGWLTDLENSNVRPYVEAAPIYSKLVLLPILEALKNRGWKIIITSWLAKDSTKEFDNAVRKAKREWLENYDFPFDEIHLVKYGTTKANCTRHHGGFQILVDDNKKVRDGWNLGSTINANHDIIKELRKLF
jgi:FMN phosphatase YigB (HAD superfamily)